REEKRLLKISQGITKAAELDKKATEDISRFRYDLAQDKYDEIRRIIRQDLQEKECEGLKKEFDENSEKLRTRIIAMNTLNDIIAKSKEGIYVVYKKDIQPVFEEGDIPELDELRKFNEKIQEQLIRLGCINREFVDDRYDTVEEGLIQLYQQITENEKKYIQGKFAEIESLISSIKGEESSKYNYSKQEDATRKLDEIRDLVSIVNDQKLKESFRAECKELGRKVWDQYNFAETVRKGRDAILRGDMDGAEREFSMVDKGRKKEIEKYLTVVKLEQDVRSNPQYYEKITETNLDRGVILGYKGMLEKYQETNDNNVIISMLQDIKEKTPAEGEENPAQELLTAFDEYNQTVYSVGVLGEKGKLKASEEKELESKKIKLKELEDMINSNLESVIESAEKYLEDNGKDILIRNIAIRLGRAYQKAGFEEKADEYLGLKEKA
ncbi:hypothetical protein KY342_05430, partial [Candidatus Woesearchaeota archaeon]|nr:hypothetical protein [Candidatus Woesearchaeota archaeon]